MFDKKTVARALCADIVAIIVAVLAMFILAIVAPITGIGLATTLIVALTAIILWKIVYIVFVSADIDIDI